MIKRFLINCVLFLLLFFTLIWGYKYFATLLVKQKYGITTAEQIQKQYSDLALQKDSLECVFLGNSRFYRAINPLQFDFCGYNFAHNNDSYNQIYYKIEYADSICPNLRMVVVCFDYVSFSYLSGTRNNIYKKYMPPEYLADYSIKDRIKDEFIFQITNSKTYIPRALSGKSAKLTNKGQYLIFGEYATETDKLTRSEDVLEIQKNYFEKICKYIKNKGLIGVFVLMPYRDCEYINFSPDYVNRMNDYLYKNSQENGLFVLDYSRDLRFMDYRQYTDHSHLNQSAGDLFSGILNNDILTKVLVY